MKIILTCNEVSLICQNYLKMKGIIPEDAPAMYRVYPVNTVNTADPQKLIEWEFEAFNELKEKK